MSERDPYEREKSQGWNARRRGEGLERGNPYTPGARNRLYLAWRQGWRERDLFERQQGKDPQ